MASVVISTNWSTLGLIPSLAQRSASIIEARGLGDTPIGTVNAWINANGGNVVRIIGGVIDVTAGVVIALGTGGLAWIPAVGLITVGLDQIITGGTNISTGWNAPSAIEFGTTQAAQAIGADPQTAQMIGAWTPAVLSLLFGSSAGMLGSARAFWDPRRFATISDAYWQGRANGASLHHWLFPQRALGVPEGLRNAGFNLLVIPRWPRIRGFNLNTWMGFALNWGTRARLEAMAVENAIRIGIPAGFAGGAYAGYWFGNWIMND